jgi:Spy/CpxP family protein refolding chaperone
MKKVILMLVMLFTVSFGAFAEDNNVSNVEMVERYNIQVNTKKLGDCLQLTTDQYDAVEAVINELSSDLMFAAVECNSVNRGMVTKNAIDKNAKYMSYILNKEQYHKYLMLLNATIRNRKIDMIE